MSTVFKWFARLVDANAKPVAGIETEVQAFDLASAAWTTAGKATSDADGQLRSKAEIAEDAITLAPALRLVEAGGNVVLSGSPRVSMSGRPPSLGVDFGELVRLAEADRFVQPRTATRVVRDDQATIGAVVISADAATRAFDSDAVRAAVTDDVTKTFTARLADSAKAIEDRDAALIREKALRAEREKSLSDSARELAEAKVTIAALRGTATTAAAAATAGVGGPRVFDGGLAAESQMVGVGDMAVKIGTDLVGAQAALKSSGFSIGNISVTARGLVQGDGSRLNLLSMADLKTVPPGMLSDVRFDMKPDTSAPGEAPITVPDVAQLTETAARRVFASVGLMLDTSYGPRALNTNAADGQAMLQTPVAGSGVARGAHVLVIFARGSGG